MELKRTWIGTGLLTGLGATACCWGPALLAGIAGVSGAASAFSWLHPLKPYLLGVSALGLSIAFYQVHRKKQAQGGCENCVARRRKKQRFDRALLYGVTVLVLLSYGYPYLASAADPDEANEPQNGMAMNMKNDSTEKELTFKVEGMSCTGCSRRIHSALMDTEGIEESDVSYEKGRAIVAYDPNRIGAEGIIERIEELGFEAEKVATSDE